MTTQIIDEKQKRRENTPDFILFSVLYDWLSNKLRHNKKNKKQTYFMHYRLFVDMWCDTTSNKSKQKQAKKEKKIYLTGDDVNWQLNAYWNLYSFEIHRSCSYSVL